MTENEFPHSPLLERLFSSRVRVRLLTLFLLHPESRNHIRALASEVGAQYNAVWKELRNLEQSGLLQSETSAGRKIYSLNPQFPLIPDLRNILLKTVGAGDLVRQTLSGLDGIEEAFIFGSFAEGEPDAESDLDLMIIGDIDVSQLAPVVGQMEEILARDVNYVLFTPTDWESRLEDGDPFAMNVRDAPKVILIGSHDGI